jgi:nicotinate phosphoribosyltransferase
MERMREGWYSDKYFINIARTLAELAARGYRFGGTAPDLSDLDVDLATWTSGTSRSRCSGSRVGSPPRSWPAWTRPWPCCGSARGISRWAGGRFVNTFDKMEVWAVHDGSEAPYDGDVLHVTPVMRVRGRYRDFAILETPTLGALTRASRVATNVYEVLKAARGKQILFFPARFDAHEVQAADGYAYQVAVSLFNQNFGKSIAASVSTDAQGDWWGGAGGGTVSHSAIACFLGDTPEATMAFAATRPPDIPRIALVDFRNDCVGTSREVIRTMFARYLALLKEGRAEEARKFKLYGVRPDTSGNMRDVSVPPLGDKRLDTGVNPRLVFAMREAIDREWMEWDLAPEDRALAERYCKEVKIAVSGGFAPAKIKSFEDLGVPADIYGVGSWLLSSCDEHGTSNDYTADVVRVRIDGRWYDLAKTGRKAADNLMLERVQ